MLSVYSVVLQCLSVVCEFNTTGDTLYVPQMTPVVIHLIIHHTVKVKGAAIGTFWHLGYSFILIYAASAGCQPHRAGWE